MQIFCLAICRITISSTQPVFWWASISTLDDVEFDALTVAERLETSSPNRTVADEAVLVETLAAFSAMHEL